MIQAGYLLVYQKKESSLLHQKALIYVNNQHKNTLSILLLIKN